MPRNMEPTVPKQKPQRKKRQRNKHRNTQSKPTSPPEQVPESDRNMASSWYLSRTFWEHFTQGVIYYSLGMYFVEIEWGKTQHSRAGWPFFLFSERVVAVYFTIEYFVRWFSAKDKLRYPRTVLGIIDLTAIVPFYIGFFVPASSLRLIRTLRVLRVLKFYRYNHAMQNFVNSFARVTSELKIIGTLVLLFIILSSTVIFECEREAQPDTFDNYSDAVWWCVVTLTTVGYGDAYPVTNMGRVVATVTVVFGLGIFGTFISLIGSSFLMNLQEETTPTIPQKTYDDLKASLEAKTGEDVSGDVVKHKLQEVVDLYLTAGKSESQH